MTAALPVDGSAERRSLPRHRAGWLPVGLALGVLTIAFGTWNIATALSHQPVHVHRTWTGAVRHLDLDVSRGSVTVTPGADTGATVEAHGSRGFTSPTDDESLSGGVLHVHSSCGFLLGTNWCSLSYRVSLPAGASVRVHAGDGSVTVVGITGSLALSSGDGSVTATRPAGPLTLSSSDGSVHVTGATSPTVDASSGDGSVHVGFVRPPRTVTARSDDGSVTVGLPATPRVAYRVDAHSGDGSVSTPIRIDPASTRRVTATSGDGSVTVQYGSG